MWGSVIRWSVSAISVTAVFVALPALAETPEPLPTVVVTATSAEQALRDAPASVTVIPAADLIDRPVALLADAL